MDCRIVMVVPYSTSGETFRAEKARPWSNTRLEMRGSVRMFDVHPDGKRFALANRATTPR